MFRLARDRGDENPVSLQTLTDHAFSYRPACREAPGLPGKATAPTRVRGGELTTGTRPSASYRGERGSSGSPSGRGVSRTATQDQRRQARIAVSSRGCWPGTTSAQGPGPVSLLASVTTVAQVRTDLQGISHAERNWSDQVLGALPRHG